MLLGHEVVSVFFRWAGNSLIWSQRKFWLCTTVRSRVVYGWYLRVSFFAEYQFTEFYFGEAIRHNSDLVNSNWVEVLYSLYASDRQSTTRCWVYIVRSWVIKQYSRDTGIRCQWLIRKKLVLPWYSKCRLLPTISRFSNFQSPNSTTMFTTGLCLVLISPRKLSHLAYSWAGNVFGRTVSSSILLYILQTMGCAEQNLVRSRSYLIWLLDRIVSDDADRPSGHYGL
jgi:hypothetical protein